MKIVICSHSRSHLLDVASSLIKLGNDVHFFSYTKRKFVEEKSFPVKNFHSTLLLAILPMLLKSRKLLRNVIDIYISLVLPKSDVYIFQSPHFPRSIKKARKKGGYIILDRGSTHVKYFNQRRLIYSKDTQNEWYMSFDEAQYDIVDCISVGSNYVKESFEECNFDKCPIFVNNYGSTLTYFKPTILNYKYDLIFVGAWSKRKGCDVLAKFLESHQEISLVHIGNIVDGYVPNTPNFTHIGFVAEKELLTYYSQSKVFILPSYDEGLALVQTQAIACGLPLVITKYTGGIDLKQYVDKPEYINVMSDITTEEIERCCNEALKQASSQIGERSYSHNLDGMSWDAYAKRYISFLETALTPINK